MHDIILGATLAIGFLLSQDGHMLIVLNQTLLSLTPFSVFPLPAFGMCICVCTCGEAAHILSTLFITLIR